MLKIKALLAKIVNWYGFRFDWSEYATNNTTDTWVPVFNGWKIQHRVIPNKADVSPTKTGSLWTAGEIKVIRRGNICQLKINGATIGAASSRTTIATLPNGFRPITQTEFLCRISANNIDIGFVNPDGTIQVDSGWKGGQRWVSVSYPVE